MGVVKGKYCDKMSKKPEIVRFYKGCNKARGGSSKPNAPWDGSAFETQSETATKQSEYNKTYYAKPGNCKASPIRPDSDSRSWMIGNVNEKMDDCTTYDGIFLSHEKPQKAVAQRPTENGVIYPVASTNSLTTTHDRNFTVEDFSPKRVIQRSRENSNKAPITTMKKDFDRNPLNQPNHLDHQSVWAIHSELTILSYAVQARTIISQLISK